MYTASSLSFSSDLVRGVHAHASVERDARRETRDARRETRDARRETRVTRAAAREENS